MKTYHYQIRMDAPLGKRYGTIHMQVEQNEVTGTMHILGAAEDFHGMLNEDGKLWISGCFMSGSRKIEYEGKGTVKEAELYLELWNREKKYVLTGCLDMGQKTEGEHEEVL